MNELTEILKSAAADPRHPVDVGALQNRIRSRRRRRRVLTVTAVALLVAIGIAGIAAEAGSKSDRTIVPTNTTADPPDSTLPAATTTVPIVESTVPASTGGPALGQPMTLTVVDGDAKPFPARKAGIRACPLVAGTPNCDDLIESVDDDGDGSVDIALRVDTDYVVNAFAHDTGWACPVAESDGTPFHHSDEQTVIVGERIDGARFVIIRPNPNGCTSDLPTVVINLFDGQGNTLAGTPALVDVCGYDPLFPPTYPIGGQHEGCSPDSGFVGPDADGLVRVRVDPVLTYDLQGMLPCVDGSFLFSDYNSSPNGYPVWTMTGNELLTEGLDLTVPGDINSCLGP